MKRLRRGLQIFCRKVWSFIYALPFGMKSAEDEIMFQKMNSTSDSSGVYQVMEKQSLGGDLLKGEVTQQVEEMRYRDYKVYRESKNYKYVGDGMVIKKDVNNSDQHKSFIHLNTEVCDSILDALNGENNAYTTKFLYNSIPQFKVETFLDRIQIKFNDNCVKLSLFFEENLKMKGLACASFEKELSRTLTLLSNGLVPRYGFYEDISEISFTTYKDEGEEDFIQYKFLELELDQMLLNNGEYELQLTSHLYFRDDLIEKYHSSSMEEKYKTNQPKDVEYHYGDIETRQRVCDICGCEVNQYDGDITEASLGRCLCHACLEKEIEKGIQHENRN
jgi:hypothetical protein